jgi:GNAT superfamily N-acetyltransferase
MAARGLEPVGRIACVVDHDHNRHHNERMGIWGFFETAQDPEVAVALFGAAEAWAREKGMAFLRGPLNPSMNYEVGMLVEGFDAPPTLMMTYNPKYYPELVHHCGYRKEKDLLAYRFELGSALPEWTFALADKLAAREDITIRLGDRKNLETELRLMNRIYNECWSRNWGFVPMTDAEILETGRTLVHFWDRDLAFFLCHKEEPVGVCLILPDLNPLLKRLNGRLGLSALIKKYLYWSEITGLRGFLFGVKEEYRQMGLPWVALHHLVRVLRTKPQFRYIELGWNLEDNQAINRLYEEGGVMPSKRYRIYRKELSSP